MMGLWDGVLEALQAVLFLLSQAYGGELGWAVLSLGILSRVTLLPLSLRLARKGRLHARALRSLKPHLERLRASFIDDPARLTEETLALYRREGTAPVDPSVLGGSLLQAPVFMALYAAVRRVVASSAESGFLWVRSLASPSVVMAVVAAAVVGLSAGAGADPEAGLKAWNLLLPAALTLVILALLPSWIGVYTVGAGLVGTLQGLLLRRSETGARGE